MTEKRKKTYYGVALGILMVKSSFRRFPGDIGNAQTWPFPVQYRIVEEAVPSRMTEMHDHSLLEYFKRAARELVEAGVDGITTTCGFLSLYQRELADWCGVPVATSSLLQVPLVSRLIHSSQRVGILTFNSDVLHGPYLDAVGVPADTPVVGMPRDSQFVRSIREGDDTVAYAVLRDEALAAATRLLREHPTVGAIVCECTNLAPFSADIHAALGVPVYDTVSLVHWFHAGLRPRRFSVNP